MFSSGSISFQIKTMPFEWEVKREFKDFEWLHDILELMYPGNIMPPRVPSKNRGRNEAPFLANREMFLNRYMQSILQVPEFRATHFVEAFLKEADPKKFEMVKKAAKK